MPCQLLADALCFMHFYAMSIIGRCIFTPSQARWLHFVPGIITPCQLWQLLVVSLDYVMPYQLLTVAFTQNGKCFESGVFVILMTSIQITTSYTIFLTVIQNIFHVI